MARTIAGSWLYAWALLGALIPATTVAIPDGISYQAYLTDADGTPLDTTISISFVAYATPIGGAPLWNQTSDVVVDQGLFSVVLANPANPFPAGLFDNPVFLGVFVAGEELLPRRRLDSVAHAFKAEDAETLTGVTAASLDESTEVAALETDVATLDSRVQALEASPADITGVAAGPGLAGGGTSGDVVVAVAIGGITSPMIGTGAVRTEDIFDGTIVAADIADSAIGTAQVADDSIGPADLDASEDFTVGGLTSTGRVDVLGPLVLDEEPLVLQATAGVTTAIEWRDPAFALTASLGSGDGDIRLRDAVRSRTVIRSDADGIGVGTGDTATGYEVSVPSLHIAGQTAVGLEQVKVQYSLTNSGACAAYGGDTCNWGSAVAICPAGTQVIGGGVGGPAAAQADTATAYAFPSSPSAYACRSADTSLGTWTCTAICARFE